ncbi:MAG: hypothetical protein N3D84_02820 [Candidatus Woesearchaeota archaeon]|nr:hypothetical protein [Candidatus Woesearchaeota archaeon]
MIEEIKNRTIGRMVFDILDPFCENERLTNEDKKNIKEVIIGQIDEGRQCLEYLANIIMKEITRVEFVRLPVSNMAESWMAIFNNLPQLYEEKMKRDMKKAMGKRNKSEEIRQYEFIEEYRQGKKKQRYDSLLNIPLDMVIYHVKRNEKKYEPPFLIYRVKKIGKVAFKTAKRICEEENRIKKDIRKGAKLTEDAIKTRIRENSIVEDIFGMKCVVYEDMSLCDRIVEYLSKTYGILEDENYYLIGHPKKREYRARHIKVNIPGYVITNPREKSTICEDYLVEMQFLKLKDFLNNEFWELNHPSKDMRDFNRMCKSKKFREFYEKAGFLCGI